ncbi:MAG TPA: hypothetical protein PLD88_10080 [Candidatus Berkiella sp.]|nr:hypothetical protein [Candidatus Berkiella sp.]
MSITLGSKNPALNADGPAEILYGNNKCYTAMLWRGESLFELIVTHDLPLTMRWLLALKASVVIRNFHQHGNLHCDIKAENMTAMIEGEKVTVHLIDTDFAKKLPNNKSRIFAQRKEHLVL